MQHSVVALVCPALYASARHLTLQGRRPISRQFFLLRAPSVCAKVSWHGAPSCQHLQWAGETVKGEPQLGEVKWYCTSTKPYTHSEIGGSAVNSARAGEKLLTNTKEFESSYNKPGSRRTKDKGVLSNAMHKIGVVEETKATAVVEVSEGSIDSFYGSEEEVDLEELIKLEIELHRQEGVPVPSEITPTQWEELLAKSSMQGRKKYLKFLFKNEMKRENTKKKKELKRKIREEKEKEMEENPKVGEDQDVHIQYGLWRNSIFLKILDTTMNHFYNSRVISAMMHGQPLVIDMGFDDHMVSRERQNCAYQIQMMLSANRTHADPYALHLCNARRSADTIQRLERYIPPLFEPDFPLIVSPESYVDRYSRDQLVYLTPHCQEEMIHYDHNAVYIIGGIVDKSCGEPLTLAKAKKEGIKMQKLPLDRYLTWGMGGKSLALNHIVKIMLDMKLTGDWRCALRHVPNRKLRPQPTGEEVEDLIRRRLEKQRKHRSYSSNYKPREYKRY